jgi:hypothetical protein
MAVCQEAEEVGDQLEPANIWNGLKASYNQVSDQYRTGQSEQATATVTIAAASLIGTKKLPLSRIPDVPESPIAIYRTPKVENIADELANGPNPANHQLGDASAYFGERSVAGDYVGMPGYAGGMVRYDMHPDFLQQFQDAAFRYDWQGPGGAARIEWAIPAERLSSFNGLTLNRSWVDGR